MDEVYGQDPRLRGLLEAWQAGYVLVIAGTARVRCEGLDWQAAITAHVPDTHWHLYSAGRGAKGHRWYA